LLFAGKSSWRKEATKPYISDDAAMTGGEVREFEKADLGNWNVCLAKNLEKEILAEV
jgi:hypothetical protein